MAPEYGADDGLLPGRRATIDYFKGTGRKQGRDRRLRGLLPRQGLFGVPATPDPFIDTPVVEARPGTVVPSLAGPQAPAGPHRVTNLSRQVRRSCSRRRRPTDGENRRPKPGAALHHQANFDLKPTATSDRRHHLVHQHLQPRRAARRRPAGEEGGGGLKPGRKPGSRPRWPRLAQVVTEYLKRPGCCPSSRSWASTCRPTAAPPASATPGDLTRDQRGDRRATTWSRAAVLSGNRNFEARIHLQLNNFLASPPLVVAYAIAGNVRIDLMTSRWARGKNGKPVYLGDIWPTSDEIQADEERAMRPEGLQEQLRQRLQGPASCGIAIEGAGAGLRLGQSRPTSPAAVLRWLRA